MGEGEIPLEVSESWLDPLIFRLHKNRYHLHKRWGDEEDGGPFYGFLFCTDKIKPQRHIQLDQLFNIDLQRHKLFSRVNGRY